MPAKPVVPPAGFSFTSFQNTRPTTPLPGGNHDTENEQLRQTDQEIIDWISGTVADDGSLRNEVVTVDSLHPDVITLIEASAAGVSAGTFAPIVHSHDALYAPLTHDHDGRYALAGHTHPGGTVVDTAAILAQALTAAQTQDTARDVLLSKLEGSDGPNGGNGANIFRVNEATLTADVTVSAGENMSCTGPLTIPTGVTLDSPPGTRVVVF